MRILFAAAAVAATAAALGAPGVDAESGCADAIPAAPAGLPAPIVLRTRCGDYTVAPDGSISAAPPAPLTQPDVDIRRTRTGRVVVLKQGAVIWRSRRAFRSAYPAAAVVGPDSVAFSFYQGSLWVARLDGTEHRVPHGRNEDPLGWTHANRLLTSRWRGDGYDVFVRRADGSRPRRLARAWAPVFEDTTETALFVAAGWLMRTDGSALYPLAKLADLGLPDRTSPELLDGGLIALRSADRLVVLRRDGGWFGSSRFPGLATLPDWGGVIWSSRPVAAGGDRVAFTIAEPDGEVPYGYLNVFVLRTGDRTGTPVFRVKVDYEGCGWFDALSWHGDWLLYQTTTGEVVALDTTGAHSNVDLTDVIPRLPGVARTEDGSLDGFADASWSD